MMDNPGDHDVGEDQRSQINQRSRWIKRLLPAREACGHYPYRDWCRACVGGTGLSDALKRGVKNKTVLLVASMDCGFITDGDDGEHSVPGGESQAEHDDLEHACAMQRCGRPGINQGNGRVVELTFCTRS